MRPVKLLALLGCALAACAMGTSPRTSEQEAQLDDARAKSLEDQLGETRPDFLSSTACDQQRALVAEICALADRVCELASREPADLPTRQRCDAGRARCERARGVMARSCAAPDPSAPPR